MDPEANLDAREHPTLVCPLEACSSLQLEEQYTTVLQDPQETHPSGFDKISNGEDFPPLELSARSDKVPSPPQ